MRQSKPRPHRPPTTIPTKRNVHDAELVDEMDALIADIDSVLEDQEWMVRFRQHGGQ